jgi:sugar lactone lactonase YvrE
MNKWLRLCIFPVTTPWKHCSSIVLLTMIVLAIASIPLSCALAGAEPIPSRAYMASDSPPQSVDGVGTEARFAVPAGMAFDSKGNLFVADFADRVIRCITPSGLVTTFVGSPGKFGHTDGVGSNARFAGPRGIAIDKYDNLFVTDVFNETIRKITPDGKVSTFAGTDGRAGNVDGSGNSATFDNLEEITIDEQGNLYVVAESAVRKITSQGEVTTLAGHTSGVVPSDFDGYRDGLRANARFRRPSALAIDRNGNVYVADIGNHVIREITPAGLVSTMASANGSSDATTFGRPSGMTIDPDGNLYLAAPKDVLVRKVSPSGVVTTVLAAADSLRVPSGTVAVAGVDVANGIVINARGVLFASVTSERPDGHRNGTILRITPNGEVATFAGFPVETVATRRSNSTVAQ